MKIQVILASTRPGRVTERLAKWVMAGAAGHDGLAVELVDLAGYPMDLFNETGSPRFNPHRDSKPVVKKWLDKLNEADGYIIVTPEYNRNMPGVLKNAIDYLDWQFERKPVAIVSHGSTGGALAAAGIREAVRQLGGINVPDTVTVNFASMLFDEAGRLSQDVTSKPYGPHIALSQLFEGLSWYAATLAAARDQTANV